MTRNALMLAGLLSAAWASTAPADEALFASQCALCHQREGDGAAGLAPPLKGTLGTYAKTAQGRDYLARVMIGGLVGSIESLGQRYNGRMPAFAQYSDAELASTLSYVLTKMNGAKPRAISAPDFAAARAENPTATATRKLREQLQGGAQ